MSFKINLKPYPAAEYFTVREYAGVISKTLSDPQILKERVAKNLRALLNIPQDYSFHIFDSTQREAMKMDQNLVIKDDPLTGIDIFKKGFLKSEDTILDLSYSFPQVSSDYSEIHHVLIDPSISLGIPVDLVFLFSENAVFLSEGRKEFDDARKFVLLDKVLNDYMEKGSDVLLRESNYKAAVLNQMIEDCSFFMPVAEKQIGSKTIILTETTPDITPRIERMGYEVGVMQENGKSILAIANYPTHSKELIEMFSDRIMMPF